MKKVTGICAVILGLTIQAQAEIEKSALVCDTGICLYWWPKLPEVSTWHQDKDASYQIGANVLVPKGFTFSNAETIVYAKALYKPKMPETKSLAMLISDDQEEFRSEDHSITITEIGSLTTADNKKLRTFTFFPKSKGNWEAVSYGEEGEFYLIFTASSKSQKGFAKSLDVFKSMIARYKE